MPLSQKEMTLVVFTLWRTRMRGGRYILAIKSLSVADSCIVRRNSEPVGRLVGRHRVLHDGFGIVTRVLGRLPGQFVQYIVICFCFRPANRRIEGINGLRIPGDTRHRVQVFMVEAQGMTEFVQSGALYVNILRAAVEFQIHGFLVDRDFLVLRSKGRTNARLCQTRCGDQRYRN